MIPRLARFARRAAIFLLSFGSMAVPVHMHHTGEAVSLLEVAAVIQDMFPDRGIDLCPGVPR